MRILITGMAGFIGFHTAMKFKEMGHDVFGFDNLNSYYDPILKINRKDVLLRDYNINCEFLDLRDRSELFRFVEGVRPDLVIHLAAMAGVRYSMEHPIDYIENNCVGSQNLIDACENSKIKNVIYASTSCVMHGNPLPWREYETFQKQINPYGYTKCINESQFHISKIPNAVGLRFFTVYGPWGRPDMALFDFTKNILEGNPITLFNNGDMKRDFTYVDDIVAGIYIVANNMSERNLYNIGFGRQVELEHFVDSIENSLGKKAIRQYGPKHPADAKETWSDTTKLQSIGYNPSTPIEVGVERFVQWYKDYYEIRG